MKIKNVNEDSGEIVYNHFKDIRYNGKKDCIKITTSLGYEITLTPDHLVYTPNGYIQANLLKSGDRIYVNGQKCNSEYCKTCSPKDNSQSLNIIYADTITNIESVGEKKVYDIEMDSEYHNFVANGVVVHNCNYSKDKFDNQIKFIEPLYFDDATKAQYWVSIMTEIEKTYMEMSKIGCTPDELRMILPHSTAAEVTMTANIREWRHILSLRAQKMAHPSVQQLMIPLLLKFKADMPELFSEIPYNEEFPIEKYAEIVQE